MRKLLVLDDESGPRTDLTLSLKVLGYDVSVIHNLKVANQDAVDSFDLIVFRAASTDVTALQILSHLRSLPNYPPVIAISERDDAGQVATLLECGCDCVLCAVPDVLQLKAWIESLLRRRDMYRRAQEESESAIRVGDLEIDVLARMVRTRTRTSELTEREMKLLLELARKPGVVCRRAELLENVWGSASESLTGTLNTHINRLRMKIEDDFRTPLRLIGVYGVGYRLAVPGQGDNGSRPESQAVPERTDSEQHSPQRSERPPKPGEA